MPRVAGDDARVEGRRRVRIPTFREPEEPAALMQQAQAGLEWPLDQAPCPYTARRTTLVPLRAASMRAWLLDARASDRVLGASTRRE